MSVQYYQPAELSKMGCPWKHNKMRAFEKFYSVDIVGQCGSIRYVPFSRDSIGAPVMILDTSATTRANIMHSSQYMPSKPVDNSHLLYIYPCSLCSEHQPSMAGMFLKVSCSKLCAPFLQINRLLLAAHFHKKV